MKFWFTLAVGVIAVAAVSTALLVMSPSTPYVPETAVIDQVESDRQVVAVVEGPMEVDHQNVGQHQQGQDIFKIRNASKTQPLVLEPMKPTCQCTSLFIDHREYSPEEKFTGDEHRAVKVDPGKVAYVIARWDTKNKLAQQRVGVPIRTNDPKQTQITFIIKLDVQREILLSGDVMDFGQINEGEKAERNVVLTSLLRDKIEISNLRYEQKYFDVKTVPMTPEELKLLNVRSGLRVFASTNGKNPVGAFAERLMLDVKTNASKEAISLTLGGRVMGDIETLPDDPTLNFNVVTKETNRPLTRDIFVRKPKPGETFKLGAAKPENTLEATFEKHPKFNMWKLTVNVKPTAAPGQIRDGQITIVDQTGKERLLFRVVGLVDPDFVRSTTVSSR